MAKFNFRLESILTFRRKLEESAKTTYLEARARRLDAEFDLQAIVESRRTTLHRGVPCLENRLALDAYLARLEDQARAQHSVIGVLTDEEEQARKKWITARQDSESIQKLRDKEYESWQRDQLRKEQSELDEWSVLRRAA